MSRAILVYRLPQERNEYTAAVHGLDWALTVCDVDEVLRKYLKYGHTFQTADEALESVRDELWSIASGYGVTRDMIE